MAAIVSFDWMVNQFWPVQDNEVKALVKSHRDYLLTLRNEDQRERYLQELLVAFKEMKKKKGVS